MDKKKRKYSNKKKASTSSKKNKQHKKKTNRAHGHNKKRKHKKRHVHSKKTSLRLSPMVKDILVSLFLSTVIAFVVILYFVSIGKMTGKAMIPNLAPNHRVLISKRYKRINRFDIVAFKRGNTTEIRRVIGLPGETIKYVDDYLYVDEQVVDEKFIVDQINESNRNNQLFTKPESGADAYQVQNIPEDSYVVLGDNRPYATDSRQYGLISEADIKGIIKNKLFPFEYLDLY